MYSRMKFYFIVFILTIGLYVQKSFAQSDSAKKVSYSLLPIIVSDPFVGFGYGVLTNVNFLLGPAQTTRYSNAQAYVINTTNGQFAAQINHQIFSKNEEWIQQGKLQFLSWPEFTYQLGARTDNNDLVKERINYKAIEFEERILKKLKTHQFIGLQYRLFNCWDIQSDKNDSISFFENAAVGTKSFITSGIGIHYIFDSRDNVQNAYKGKYLELSINDYAGWLGSTQNWINIKLDTRYYHSFKTKKSLVLASRFLGEQAIGTIPYMVMPQFGRYFTTRAYAQGRYRGNLFLTFETELRANIWKWLGGVAFAGVSTVSESNDAIKYYNPNIGTGLRFQIKKEQRTNLRFDYAWGVDNNSGLYFQITEVF